MVVGQISQTQLRIVCGMLVGARLSGSVIMRAHRFFSAANWSVDELGLKVAELIVERLLAPGAPLIVPVDDTLAKRRGRKVHGCCWHNAAPLVMRHGPPGALSAGGSRPDFVRIIRDQPLRRSCLWIDLRPSPAVPGRTKGRR